MVCGEALDPGADLRVAPGGWGERGLEATLEPHIEVIPRCCRCLSPPGECRACAVIPAPCAQVTCLMTGHRGGRTTKAGLRTFLGTSKGPRGPGLRRPGRPSRHVASFVVPLAAWCTSHILWISGLLDARVTGGAAGPPCHLPRLFLFFLVACPPCQAPASAESCPGR